jgi:hypothetical protein
MDGQIHHPFGLDVMMQWWPCVRQRRAQLDRDDGERIGTSTARNRPSPSAPATPCCHFAAALLPSNWASPPLRFLPPSHPVPSQDGRGGERPGRRATRRAAPRTRAGRLQQLAANCCGMTCRKPMECLIKSGEWGKPISSSRWRCQRWGHAGKPPCAAPAPSTKPESLPCCSTTLFSHFFRVDLSRCYPCHATSLSRFAPDPSRDPGSVEAGISRRGFEP